MSQVPCCVETPTDLRHEVVGVDVGVHIYSINGNCNQKNKKQQQTQQNTSQEGTHASQPKPATMVFTVLAAADVYGNKVNYEFDFPVQPTMSEFQARITSTFTVDASARAPAGAPTAFSIHRMQIFDDRTDMWNDLLSGAQLVDYCQVYVFQRESPWHREVQSKIPPAIRAPHSGTPPALVFDPNAAAAAAVAAAAADVPPQFAPAGAYAPMPAYAPTAAPYLTPEHAALAANAAAAANANAAAVAHAAVNADVAAGAAAANAAANAAAAANADIAAANAAAAANADIAAANAAAANADLAAAQQAAADAAAANAAATAALGIAPLLAPPSPSAASVIMAPQLPVAPLVLPVVAPVTIPVVPDPAVCTFEHKVRVVYEVMGLAGEGRVDQAAFASTLSALRIELGDVATALFAKADANKDLLLQYQEFAKFCESYPTVLDSLFYRHHDSLIDAAQQEAVQAAKRTVMTLRERESEARVAAVQARRESDEQDQRVRQQAVGVDACAKREADAKLVLEGSQQEVQRTAADVGTGRSEVVKAREFEAAQLVCIFVCLFLPSSGRGKGREGKGKERKGKERKGKERKGKERKGKERKGKERKGKERKGKERKGKERKGTCRETRVRTPTRTHTTHIPQQNNLAVVRRDIDAAAQRLKGCESDTVRAEERMREVCPPPTHPKPTTPPPSPTDREASDRAAA